MHKESNQFFVKGRGNFPLDMLRYDDCSLAVPEMKAALDIDPEHYFRSGAVVLIEMNEGSRWIHPGRWASFGWQVLGLPSHIDAATNSYPVAISELEDVNPYYA